jgi:hypothetical protein
MGMRVEWSRVPNSMAYSSFHPDTAVAIETVVGAVIGAAVVVVVVIIVIVEWEWNGNGNGNGNGDGMRVG